MYVFYANTNTPEKLYALGLDSNGVLYATWALPGVGFGDLSDYDGFNPNYDQNAVGLYKGVAVVAWNRVSSGFYNIFTCNIHSDKSTCSSMVTGVENISAVNEGYEIYPNPAANQLILSGNYSGTKDVRVFNVLGQTLLSLTNTTPQTTLNVSELKPGTYFIWVNELNTSRKVVMKFVKE